MIIIFYSIAAFIIISSILAVSLKNILHSALCLALALIGVACVYIILSAEFLAAMQLLIYVGAVVTLILFAIMLTHKIADRNVQQTNRQGFISFLVSTFIFGTLIYAILNTIPVRDEISSVEYKAITVPMIANSFITTYVLPFEVISLILLACLVGAIVIASGRRG